MSEIEIEIEIGIGISDLQAGLEAADVVPELSHACRQVLGVGLVLSGLV